VLLPRASACRMSACSAAAHMVVLSVGTAAAKAAGMVAAGVTPRDLSARTAADSTRGVGKVLWGLLLAAQLGSAQAYGCSSDSHCSYCGGRCVSRGEGEQEGRGEEDVPRHVSGCLRLLDGMHGHDLTVWSVDGAHVVTADLARTRRMLLLRLFDL